MAEGNLTWEDVGRGMDAHNNNLLGDVLGGDATSLVRSVVDDIVADVTGTEVLAVTYGAVSAL